jgi:hypothetical protein
MNNEQRRLNELIDEGLATLPRDGDGAVERASLREYVAERMPFDEDHERLNRAERAIAARQRPGSAPVDGQLRFEGMEPYAYEPQRLVEGPGKEVVENRLAKPSFKSAEADRTMINAQRALRQAQRRQQEASNYGNWVIDRVRDGDPWVTITFGRFVQESGVHENETPPPESPDNGD